MSGMIYPLLDKTSFTFTHLGVSGTQDILIASAIPVEGSREGTIVLRVHSGTAFTGGGGTPIASVELKARIEAPSSEDPSVVFMAATPELVTGLVVDAAVTPPALLTAVLASGFGGRLRVFLRATQSPTTPTTFTVMLSAELILKA